MIIPVPPSREISGVEDGAELQDITITGFSGNPVEIRTPAADPG